MLRKLQRQKRGEVLHRETQAGFLPKSRGSKGYQGVYSPRLYFR